MKNSKTIEFHDIRVLRYLVDDLGIRLLTLLAEMPLHTRELSNQLDIGEAMVSRKLRMLERFGLVRGSWKRKNNKTVKEYTLEICNIHIKTPKIKIKILLCENCLARLESSIC